MIRMMLAAAAVLASTASFALELPKDAVLVPEEPPPIPVFSWTGYAVGVHAGYGFGHDSATLRSRVGGGRSSLDPNGIIGGFHAGYNRALPGLGAHALVLGIEGDVDGADYQKTTPFGGLGTVAVRSDIKGSIRGRLGLGVNRVLFYATGGAAFANFDIRYNGTSVFGAGAFDAKQRTQVGYTIGGGVEYAFMNYVTVRAEYRYSDYGTFTDTLATAAPGANASIVHRDSDSRLQAAVSYKFDSIAP